MKKIILTISLLFFVTGCSIGKKDIVSPSKKVEKFFNNYINLNDEVIRQLNEAVEKENDFNAEDKESYINIMKDHYKNLKYDIKDEVIDGDSATVTVEIEVKDYSKIMSEAEAYLNMNKEKFNNENGEYDPNLFVKYRLENLKNAKEKVKYTLYLTLTKIDNEWVMDSISETDETKIHGMYIY